MVTHQITDQDSYCLTSVIVWEMLFQRNVEVSYETIGAFEKFKDILSITNFCLNIGCNKILLDRIQFFFNYL